MEKDNLQHLYYGLILLIVIIVITTIGYSSLNNVREDYNAQINSLNSALTSLNQTLQSELKEKQSQIDNLVSQFTETSIQIFDLNKQYEKQFGELNQQLSDLNVQTEGFTEIISEVIGSVVSVLTDKGQGSGVIIRSEGFVVTNYHVIEDAQQASILTFDEELYGVQLIGQDIANDLAILKIISNETFEYLEFADSDDLKTGQKIVALGNPAGLSFTATEGIISSPSRFIKGNTFIQTDVTINPGNSGGPIINSQGEIVGIINFKIAGFEELGFAIPSNRVKEVTEEIIG